MLVDQDALEVGGAGPGLDPHRLDPAGHPDPVRHWASPIGLVPAPALAEGPVGDRLARSAAGRPVGGPLGGPGRRRAGRRRPRRGGGRRSGSAATGAGCDEPAAGQLVGDDGGAHVGQLAHRGGDLVGRAVVEEPLPAGGEAAPGQEDGALGVPVGHRRRRPARGRPGPGGGRGTRRCRAGAGSGPSRLHSASSSAGHLGSRCRSGRPGARRGCRVRAYWRARAVAMSRRSTSTIDDVAAEDRRLGGLGPRPPRAACSSSTYWRCRRMRPAVHERAEHDHHPGPLGELGDGEDEDDDGGEEGGEAVDQPRCGASGRPCGSRWCLTMPGPGHGEAGEHPDGVEGHQAVDLGPGDQDQGDAPPRRGRGSRWRRPGGGPAGSAAGAGTESSATKLAR